MISCKIKELYIKIEEPFDPPWKSNLKIFWMEDEERFKSYLERDVPVSLNRVSFRYNHLYFVTDYCVYISLIAR